MHTFIVKLFSATFALLVTYSCSAESSINTNPETVKKLLNKFFPEHKQSKKPEYKLGDFNNDGLQDIAVLFTPKSKPTESKQLKVLTPWIYATTKKTNKYHKSLVIFHKTNSQWLSNDTHGYVLLDNNGVLETPSFQLLITRKEDKDYISHVSELPIMTKSDLIILPTEAGIDTYVYWDKDTYKLFEPEEMP